MNKIKITGYFKNSALNSTINYDCYGIKKDNIISFKNENDNIKLTLNKDSLIFIKENEETILTYNFISNMITTNNTYKLKQENLVATLEIETKTIKINENSILIEFVLTDSNDKYQLNIDYKVV